MIVVKEIVAIDPITNRFTGMIVQEYLLSRIDPRKLLPVQRKNHVTDEEKAIMENLNNELIQSGQVKKVSPVPPIKEINKIVPNFFTSSLQSIVARSNYEIQFTNDKVLRASDKYK
jgi:hypothetical protein